MQTILPPSGNTIKILGKARSAEHGLRWMHYVLAQPVEGGVLVFHTLTRALLLLTPEEYAAPDNLPELRDGWFRVPQEMDDMKYADQVRFIRRTMWKEPEHITSYTIFTTTDCNARCFYCYEMGRSRIPMSAETAHKAAAYIAAHCGGEKVHLHWFGGEPLFNKQVIDIICTDLTEKGIVYESMMISNGYLFDGATVEQAVSHWKLKSVQITLDGTEEIYNRSKAFIYKDGQSPYQVVLANIQRLLDAGVSVHIRLNMDEHNADNLMELADELHERFGGKGKFSVYSHTLFEFAGSKTHIRAQEERRQLYQKQQRLRKKLDDCGIGASYYLRQKLRIRQCMADSGGSLTILPNGELGLCEHYSEDNFVVLQDVSLTVRKGEYVVFTGPSGCGKSTLLKLLMCLYPLDSGQRFLSTKTGNQPLTPAWKSLFAYVPQGNQLLSGSIRSIVAFGDEDRAQDENAIYNALKIACADDFVRRLENGLDTVLGERGAGLSEGQMQRIAIARAVYSNHPILLLDEATSALDEATALRLLNNLRKMTDKTVILVTHRMNQTGFFDAELAFSKDGICVRERKTCK